MLEIVILACLVNSPEKCEEVHMPLEGAAGTYACMREAHMQLARWQTEHPDYVVKRWKCR